jgi:outer membrane murein-binding lipoprotein Lpp
MPKVNGFRMKKMVLAGTVLLVLVSCTNEGGTTEQKIDSLEQKIDTTLQKAQDSIAVKAQILKERIQDKWKNRKDSVNRRDSSDRDTTKF